MTAKAFTYKNEHYRTIKEFAIKHGLTYDKIYKKYFCYFVFDTPIYKVNGKEFDTLSQIAREFNLKLSALIYEHKLNPDIQACVDYLKTKHNNRGVFSKDFLGNTFTSASAMCEYWGIKQVKLCKGLAAGLSVEDAIMGKTKLRKLQFIEKNRSKFTKQQLKEIINRITNGD